MPLPAAHRRALQPYLQACAASAPTFRWVASDNLHLTVRFLGNVDAGLAGRLQAELRQVTYPSFPLQLSSPGSFGRAGRARVLWLGLASGENAMAGLAAVVETACRRAGLPPQERALSPHLTLARSRDHRGAPSEMLPEPPALGPWRAEHYVLYRSQLGRGGPVYTPLNSFDLETRSATSL